MAESLFSAVHGRATALFLCTLKHLPGTTAASLLVSHAPPTKYSKSNSKATRPRGRNATASIGVAPLRYRQSYMCRIVVLLYEWYTWVYRIPHTRYLVARKEAHPPSSIRISHHSTNRNIMSVCTLMLNQNFLYIYGQTQGTDNFTSAESRFDDKYLGVGQISRSWS